jgi:hypothetical protein
MSFKKTRCRIQISQFSSLASLRNDMVFRLDAHQSATSVRTTRTFLLDAYQCLEASNSSSLHLSGRNGKSSGRSSEFEKILVFQLNRPDDVAIPYWRHSVFDKHWGFCFKTQLWEDGCNRPDYVWSRSDDVFHKASRAYKVQPSWRQSSWSRRSSIIYGNCVHQFNCPDISLQGSYSQSLITVITCSRSATVWTLGQHRPDAALLWKLSVLLWKGSWSWY